MVKSSIAESICSRSRCDTTVSASQCAERMKLVVHVRLSLFSSLELFGPVLVSVKTFNEHLCFRVGLFRRHVELGLQPEEILFVSRGRKRTPARSAAKGSKRLCTVCLPTLRTVAFCCYCEDLCYVNTLIHAGVSCMCSLLLQIA